MAKTDILMPQMGESIAEGTIVRWLKQVGDAVERDEPLFEISTDKVDAEIPAPAAGVLVAIHAAAGTTAAVNSAVGMIEGSTGSSGSTGAPALFARLAPVAPFEPSTRRASPVARLIAHVHNINLETLTGTGGAGRITKNDVLARLEPGARVEREPVAPRAPIASLEPAVVPMSVMRKKIAEHMIASRRTSAHVYSTFEVDCSRVDALRKAWKAEYEAAGAKLSILPFVVKAAASALREMPLVNASLSADSHGGDSIVYHGDVNVGIAVALDNGLIVPVIRRADALSLRELSLAIVDVAKRARAKQLKPEEVAGGTFTVTNPGNFGGAFATPIINQPQVAILELGTVEKRVVVRNDALAIRPMMNLTLGFDHRLIDGVAADQFLAAIKKTLETWT